MSYAAIYYAVLAAALLVLPIYWRPNRSLDGSYLKLVCTAGLLVLYFGALLRTDGVDFEVYRENYLNPLYENAIPDPGFQGLMAISRALHAPFSVIVLFMGTVSIAAIYRLSHHFRIDVTLLLLVWLMHLAVVRDFSQTRVGFAFAIAVFGLTARRPYQRACWYALAVSMHLSSIAFVLAYEYCMFTAHRASRSSRMVWLSVGAAVITLCAASLPYLSFLDERIGIYLAWEASGYGAPVDSYGTLFLHALILLTCILTHRRWSDLPEMRAIYYLEWLGVLTFLAFSSVAIFAFRLSNLLFSMYPVLLLYVLSAWQYDRSTLQPRFAPGLALYLIAAILILRPGSLDVLGTIRFGGL